MGNVAIDTEAQKPNVHLGGKYSEINGKDMDLTWEVCFFLRDGSTRECRSKEKKTEVSRRHSTD